MLEPGDLVGVGADQAADRVVDGLGDARRCSGELVPAVERLALQGDFTYMDDHFLDLENNPNSFEDAFIVANARISYATEDNRYEVSVWTQNVGDEEYRTFNGPITGNGYTLQQFGKPRWAGATLRVNF